MDIFHGASEVTAVREDITANLQAEAEEEHSAVRFFLGPKKWMMRALAHICSHTHTYIYNYNYIYIYIHTQCVCV